jgi:hypothetical protein
VSGRAGDRERNGRGGRSIARSVLVLLSAAAITASTVAFSQDGASSWEYSLTSGLNYSTGDYGTDRTTEIWVVPFVLKAQKGRFSASLIVPYIRSTGPAVIRELGLVVGDTTTQRTVTGLGDISANVSYDWYARADGTETASVSGKVKFPTGDREKGLGTGNYDYSLQLDGTKVMGNVALLGSVGYRIHGDLPDVDLRNVVYGSVGAFYVISSVHSVGITYDTRRRIIAQAAVPHDVNLFYSYKASEQTNVLLLLGKGFSNASQDWGGGLMFVWRL